MATTSRTQLAIDGATRVRDKANRISDTFEGLQEQDQSCILTVDADGEKTKHHVHVRSARPDPSRGLCQGRLFTRHPQPS